MDEHKNEVPYTVEPVNDYFQLDIGTIALYKIEPDFPDATELINEFIKITDEFKIKDRDISNEG